MRWTHTETAQRKKDTGLSQAGSESSACRSVTNKRLARRRYYDVSEAHKSLYCLWSRRRVQIRTHGVTRDRILN